MRHKLDDVDRWPGVQVLQVSLDEMTITDPPPPSLLILGAGSFAMVVTEIAMEISRHQVIGYAVNMEPKPDLTEEVLGRPVWWLEDVGEFNQVAYAIAAIVSPERKGIINHASELGFRFATIVHPSAAVARSAILGHGVILERLVAVSYGASLDHHVVVNRGATIGHHCNIEPFSTIGPGANLGGRVQVGASAVVGMGANVLENRSIGADAVVGAGAVVTRDVRPGAKVMGVPAREVS